MQAHLDTVLSIANPEHATTSPAPATHIAIPYDEMFRRAVAQQCQRRTPGHATVKGIEENCSIVDKRLRVVARQRIDFVLAAAGQNANGTRSRRSLPRSFSSVLVLRGNNAYLIGMPYGTGKDYGQCILMATYGWMDIPGMAGPTARGSRLSSVVRNSRRASRPEQLEAEAWQLSGRRHLQLKNGEVGSRSRGTVILFMAMRPRPIAQ